MQYLKLTLSFLLVSSVVVTFGQRLNLPTSITDLLPHIEFDKDPDEERGACEIIEARGFGCQRHYVRTKQNYIVEMHRIVQADGETFKGHSRPVILQPGLIGSSIDFIMASPEVPSTTNVTGMNMGFELARRGYDVWLSNNRGNIYGKNHTSLSPDDPKFWRWTWDELSEFDIPAFIDYVREETSSKNVAYVGHSQGTTLMFALLSRTRDYNKIIEPYISINPVTRIGNATTTFRLLIEVMKLSLNFDGGVFEGLPAQASITSISCRNIIVNKLCSAVFMSAVGFDSKELNATRLSVYLMHQPTSTSARNLLHFDQMFHHGKFANYDFGWLGNLKTYGRLTPPEYNLANISHPAMHVIYAANDLYVPLESVERLRTDLGTAREFYQLQNSKASHIDPLIGLTISRETNDKVFSILRQYDN